MKERYKGENIASELSLLERSVYMKDRDTTQPLSYDPIEESLVCELELLGIGYLARHTSEKISQRRAPEELLAALVKQPSSRVRTAVIAVLLANPRFADAMPDAIKRLSSSDQLTLKIYYTAAVILQRKYAAELISVIRDRWKNLPDLYGREFNLNPESSADDLLIELGHQHRYLTGLTVNWSGTYENVAHHLLRRWEVERKWNQ